MKSIIRKKTIYYEININHQKIIPARDPKQCGGSGRIM
jgi:hypothetical protein